MPEFQTFTFQTAMLSGTKEAIERDCRAHAEQFLAVIKTAAAAAGVACATAFARSRTAYFEENQPILGAKTVCSPCVVCISSYK